MVGVYKRQELLTPREHLGSSPVFGGVTTYPSRASGFIPSFWWSHYLPFESIWVHPRCLVGSLLTLREHLGSSPVFGGVTTYLSRASGFIPGVWWGPYCHCVVCLSPIYGFRLPFGIFELFLLIVFSVLCHLFCFVCVRRVSYVPNVTVLSGLYILDCPFRLFLTCID